MSLKPEREKSRFLLLTRSLSSEVRNLLYPTDLTLVEKVYAQSVRGTQFFGTVLALSFAYSVWHELHRENQVSLVLTLIQFSGAISIVALPVIVKPLRTLASLFGLLMFVIAMLEMEIHFHDTHLEHYDARSWIGSLALMAAFSFFHIGPPLQFITLWSVALSYYAGKALFQSQWQIPAPLFSLITTILPFSLIWMILNGWWFRIRLQNTQAREELQRANSTLTEIDRFRSNFFAGISHEFRTPLTLILSPLQSFLERTSRGDEIKPYLISVMRNGNRLLTLVNNLIDLARLDSGRMHLNLEPVDLCEVVRGILSVFDQSYRTRGLSLRSELPLQLLTSIDIGKTETILINLLGNALKFTMEGGAVVKLKQHGHQITISVEDSGPGLDAKEQGALFERFGPIRNSRSGSGLGLALSRELARFMEGELSLKSSSEAGSVFELRLPVHPILFNDKNPVSTASTFKLPDEIEGVTIPSSTSAERERILIVEDDIELRNYLCRIVAERFTVLTASNGEEALLCSEKQLPDAVISDIVMPSMDGFELVQRFREGLEPRQRGERQNIPFLFLTARAGLEDRLESLKLGVDDYLVKPFDPAELLEKVAGLIRRKKREEEGLRSERMALVGDLHDMLGSDLTDLLIILGSMNPDEPPGDQIDRARQLARSVLGGLRDRIHEREDMELIQDNFMHGVKVILNRRYAAVGRGIRFRFDHDEEGLFIRDLRISQRHALYAVFLEISTNDLKYGSGISIWELTYRNGFFDAAFQSETTSQPATAGRLSFVHRLEQEGGTCSENSKENHYRFSLKMQLSGYTGQPALS